MLHSLARTKVEPLWVDAGHNDVYTHCEREVFDAVGQFLESLDNTACYGGGSGRGERGRRGTKTPRICIS